MLEHWMRMRQARKALAEVQASNEKRQPVRTFCPIWRNPWMTIGPGTYNLVVQLGNLRSSAVPFILSETPPPPPEPAPLPDGVLAPAPVVEDAAPAPVG